MLKVNILNQSDHVVRGLTFLAEFSNNREIIVIAVLIWKTLTKP